MLVAELHQPRPQRFLEIALAGDAGPVQRLTFHADDAVRRARISHNGEWIVYECGADLYVVPVAGGKPKRLTSDL